MDTALKSEEEKKEYFDSETLLADKITVLADLIKNSKHFVVFTGAGISTAAGIPDFRSGHNTVLKTGAGLWERHATEKDTKIDHKQLAMSAIPTKTHMALLKLKQAGILKFLISQNTDGLHKKSGFLSSEMVELHGNANIEYCANEDCKAIYHRAYSCRTAKEAKQHKTGRFCDNCQHELRDSIVSFGDSLPEYDHDMGFKQAKKADLILCLGSSLRVRPAADMPLETLKNGGKIVIVNLQATPLDEYALKINAMIEDVMVKIMEKLNLEIPEFSLKRRWEICKKYKFSPEGDMSKIITVGGCDELGRPYTIFDRIKWVDSGEEKKITKQEDPCTFKLDEDRLGQNLKLKLEFIQSYSEPPIEMEVPFEDLYVKKPLYYQADFDCKTKKWGVVSRFELGESRSSKNWNLVGKEGLLNKIGEKNNLLLLLVLIVVIYIFGSFVLKRLII